MDIWEQLGWSRGLRHALCPSCKSTLWLTVPKMRHRPLCESPVYSARDTARSSRFWRSNYYRCSRESKSGWRGFWGNPFLLGTVHGPRLSFEHAYCGTTFVDSYVAVLNEIRTIAFVLYWVSGLLSVLDTFVEHCFRRSLSYSTVFDY